MMMTSEWFLKSLLSVPFAEDSKFCDLLQTVPADGQPFLFLSKQKNILFGLTNSEKSIDPGLSIADYNIKLEHLCQCANTERLRFSSPLLILKL